MVMYADAVLLSVPTRSRGWVAICELAKSARDICLPDFYRIPIVFRSTFDEAGERN